jgi:hypothetical protein
MPRQARKPCSGCDLLCRISVVSIAVAGPMAAASWPIRSIVHSACRRCARGNMFRQRRVPASHAAAHVDGNTFTLVEQFDGTRGDAGLDHFAD